MKTFIYENEFGKFNLTLRAEKYMNNDTLAVAADNVDDDDVFGILTVNLNHPLQDGTHAFVDTNNYGKAIMDFLRDNRIAKYAGTIAQNGFCTYPLFKFNLKTLK